VNLVDIEGVGQFKQNEKECSEKMFFKTKENYENKLFRIAIN